MRTRTFGKLGWKVSEVGHGLWGAGGWTGSDDTESIAAMVRAMELGCTFFDTALAYGNGKSEQLLARALAEFQSASGPRGQIAKGPKGQVATVPANEIRVATKIPPKNMKWPAAADALLDDVFPADYIRSSTEISLANLGMSCVDLQQFHVWTDSWTTDDRWQRAADDLKSEGLVRAIGISVGRANPNDVLRAVRTGVIDSVQVVYNLLDQRAEDELLPACREMGVAVIARVPFDEGSLTGVLTPETTWPEGDFRNSYFRPDLLPEVCQRVDAIRADLPEGMSLPELALRFILSNQDVTTIIPGMRRPRHVEANLATADGPRLPADLLTHLRRHRWDGRTL